MQNTSKKYETPLGQVRGLGSAKSGHKHWWYQRLTAIALVPLSLWFLVSLMGQISSTSRQDAVEWLVNPFNSILLTLFALAGLWHAKLGLQVVIEDYIHSECCRITLLIALKFLVVLAMVICVFAVFYVVTGA